SVRQYAVAGALAPDQGQPHMQLGGELGRLRKPALAELEFRQVLQLDPDSTLARVNLGIAFYEQEKFADSRKEFENVLQRDPSNAIARHYTQLLLNRTPLPTPINPP